MHFYIIMIIVHFCDSHVRIKALLYYFPLESRGSPRQSEENFGEGTGGDFTISNPAVTMGI